MSEPSTYSTCQTQNAPRRRHSWWLTGLLVGCLLPLAVSTALVQYRWDVLSAELARIAFQVPETIRAVSLRRSASARRRLAHVSRQGFRPWFQAFPRRVVTIMVCGHDVLSRRGPPVACLA